MGDIGIGIKVDKSQVVGARAEIKKLLDDCKKDYGIDLGVSGSGVGSVNNARGGGVSGATTDKVVRGAGMFRRETEAAQKATSGIVRDFEKLIKITQTRKPDPWGPTIDPVSEAESKWMRRESERDAKAVWAAAGINPKRKTAAEQYYEQHGNMGRTSRDGVDENGQRGNGGGGGYMANMVGKLAPYAIAAYGLNKMKQLWDETGGSTQRIFDSQIPLDRLNETVPMGTLREMNKRFLMDPLASLGVFNTLAHSGLASKGISLTKATMGASGRAIATSMEPEEMAQKQSAIGQHVQNISYSSGQSQSDILANSIINTGTKSLAPRLFDATIRLMSSVGNIRGQKDMPEAQANKMAHLMASFWEFGTKHNSQYFMGGGVENLYTKAAGAIAGGGGDPNTKMFMSRALGADKITNLETMWDFRMNMGDATNPQNQSAVAKEALKMASQLGLKGKEAGAFAKMQLQEAYGGIMTPREINTLISPEYNGMLNRASGKPGREVNVPSPHELAESSPGMRYKGERGLHDIDMAGKLGEKLLDLKVAIGDLTGSISKLFNENTTAVSENTEALRDKRPEVNRPGAGNTERYRIQKGQ